PSPPETTELHRVLRQQFSNLHHRIPASRSIVFSTSRSRRKIATSSLFGTSTRFFPSFAPPNSGYSKCNCSGPSKFVALTNPKNFEKSTLPAPSRHHPGVQPFSVLRHRKSFTAMPREYGNNNCADRT